MVLPSDVGNVTATAEVSAKVGDDTQWYSATASFGSMKDGSIRNVAVIDSDAPADSEDEEDEPAFAVKVNSATFQNGDATVELSITNNGTGSMTYFVSAGTAWNLDQDYAFTVAGGQTGTFTVTGYYDASRVAPGQDGVDVVVTDINGADTVTTPIVENKAPHEGSLGMDVLKAGQPDAASDRVSASQYGYALTFVNKDNYSKQVTIDFTVPAGWYATIVDEDGTHVYAVGSEITVAGLETVTLYVSLMQMASEPESEVSAPSINANVTIGNGGQQTVSLSPAAINVNTDSAGVSGGSAMDERSGMPAGIWFLVALIILMVIAVFWLASKRGVMSR